MFQPTPYSDMTAAAVATVNTASGYHQSASGNTPVYVPGRALSHSQYGQANFHGAVGQNGWPTDVNFRKFHHCVPRSWWV